jgi:lysyl-tRNA synthetase class 2
VLSEVVLKIQSTGGELHQESQDRLRVKKLVECYGSDSLSYFNLRWDKNLFFYKDDSFLAYRKLMGMALISGDPIGRPEFIPGIIKEFRKYCAQKGWPFAFFAASEDYLPFYKEAGLRPFFLGEEAVIRLSGFSLEGRKMKDLRHGITKVKKMGITMEFMFNAGIPPHLARKLRQISREWRGDKPEAGFSMGLGRLFHPEDEICLLCLAHDRDYQPIGFLHLVPIYPNVGYSLDISRARNDAPNGIIEFMFANTAQYLMKHGYQFMSLHFCFFSQHYRYDREEPGSPFARFIAKLVNYRLPVISLYNFDKRFLPLVWKKRFIIYERILDFPRIILACLRAESAMNIR